MPHSSSKSAANMTRQPPRKRVDSRVADRDLALERLAEIEAYYNTAPVGLCVLDTELRYVRINQRLAEINGLPVSAHLGRTIQEIVPEIAEQAEPLLREVLESGEAMRDIEIAVELPGGADGEVTRVESWYPMKDASGRVFGINIVAEDVTVQKQAEADRKELLLALAEERLRLKTVIEQLPVGVILVEAPSGAALLANEESTRILRQPFDSVRSVEEYGKWKVFRLDGELMTPKQYPLARAVREGEVITGEEVMIERGDGSRGVVSVNAAPICDEEGRIVAGVLAFFDITERKRGEQEIARLNAELGVHIADRSAELDLVNQELRQEIAERQRLESEIVAISERVQSRIGQDLHDDLGQQLSAIAMLTGALERGLLTAAHPKAAAVSQLSAMLKGAVETTRTLAKGLYPMELEKGGLMLALKELARGAQALSGIECVVKGSIAFPLGEPMAIHLYRIAQEALNNAIKHGQPRRVLIECASVDGVPTLSITNDGTPFRKPRGRHRGLGLHILDYRAHLLGAEISIVTGPEGGCRVTCSLTSHASEEDTQC
jgi:PAS domain S-box-containing protein